MEDYDDLMLIWTPQSESLKETYGEYLLVDLLEREGEENQAAVCEVSLQWPLVLSDHSLSDVLCDSLL